MNFEFEYNLYHKIDVSDDSGIFYDKDKFDYHLKCIERKIEEKKLYAYSFSEKSYDIDNCFPIGIVTELLLVDKKNKRKSKIRQKENIC